MSQRTRYFLVGSGLIIVVGLCTGLVAFYNGNLPLGRSVGPAEFNYVTSDVAAVAYADVRHIMDSEFRQRLRAVLPSGQEKDRMLAETGIDLERDIDTVVAGLKPDNPAGGPVVIVRGRFDEARIEALAVQHGATAESYRGKRLLTSPVNAGGAPMTGEVREAHHGGIAFLEPGLLALGNVSAIRRAIDASQTNDTVTNNAELMKFVSDVVNGDAWIVGRVDALSNTKLPDPVKDQLSTVQWFALSAGINRTVTGRLRAEARDAEAGEQVRAVVNGAIAVARLMSDRDKRLDGVLDSVQATGTGTQIDLSFTVPPDVLDYFTPFQKQRIEPAQ
jgi:hypothetical protein